MKILFDYTPLCKESKTGIPVFTESLYNALENHPDVVVEKTFSFCNYIPIKPWKVYRLFERVLYREMYLPFKLHFGKYDAYIESDYMFIPIFKPKNTLIVTMIYDISLLLFEGLQTSTHNKKWANRLQTSIKNSDVLITISHSSQQDIRNYLPEINASHKVLDYIYADSAELTSYSKKKILKGLNIYDDYFLFLGTLEPRKNPLNLIKAFHAYKQSSGSKIKLVFAGKKGWLYDDVFTYIEQHDLEHEVIFTGFVSDDEKAVLLDNAKAFLFLSLYEGFGIPLLEALKFNTPVLASDIPVFHELFGENVLYAKPLDIENIAKMMEKILHSPPKIDTSVFHKFSWESSADKLVKIIQKNLHLPRNSQDG